MASRFPLTVLLVAWISAAGASGIHPRTDHRMHEGGICWEPDVEFPVPCDDDDD